MKIKTTLVNLVYFGLLAVVVLSCTLWHSYHTGYRRGYAQGGRDESACWTLDPTTTENFSSGVVTARRDTRKYPLLTKATPIFKMNPAVNSVNSIPSSSVPPR